MTSYIESDSRPCHTGTTLQTLATCRPNMKHQAARVCIVAGYQNIYNKIDPTPDEALITEVQASPKAHCLRDLERKVAAAAETAGKAHHAKYGVGE